MKKIIIVVSVFLYVTSLFAGGKKDIELWTQQKGNGSRIPTDDWYWTEGQKALQDAMNKTQNTKKAKNVILFVADGNGPVTVTATRIFQGQRNGNSGEENFLCYEKFPYFTTVKTYNVNQQVPDSAGTSTALHSGVKTNAGVIGVDSNIIRGDHSTTAKATVRTILEMAEQAGMATGVISTARVTHATPAAAYAHSAHRNWEDDKDIPDSEKEKGAIDIARQLLEFSYGDGLEVALGGGRRSFLPNTTDDPEDEGKKGERLDGRNLAEEWVQKYPNAQWVWNKKQFDKIDAATTDHLLGLFNRSHMQYEADRNEDRGGEPSIVDMTKKAIEILSKNENGFYLMVESGRVDHANHAVNIYRTLTDGLVFAEAVQAALDMTDPEETLIIVTADHSHTMTMAGYQDRGNPILGKAMLNGKLLLALDGKPYTTLGFANGVTGLIEGESREDITNVDTEHKDYTQQVLVPMYSETHSGEDVGVYAIGPWAHLFQTTQEQSFIFHVMTHALDLQHRIK